MSQSKLSNQNPHDNDVEQQKCGGTTGHLGSQPTSTLAGAMLLFIALSWCLGAFYVFPPVLVTRSNDQRPHVHTRNGTYRGVHLEQFSQDCFLGMPYAQPPIANLRFRRPQELNTSWIGTREAVEYSPHCVGSGVSLSRGDCFVHRTTTLTDTRSTRMYFQSPKIVSQ